VNPLVFETSASTDSAIWALAGTKVNYFFDSQKQKCRNLIISIKKETLITNIQKIINTTGIRNSFSANNRFFSP
jgi:hypothetical protein